MPITSIITHWLTEWISADPEKIIELVGRVDAVVAFVGRDGTLNGLMGRDGTIYEFDGRLG